MNTSTVLSIYPDDPKYYMFNAFFSKMFINNEKKINISKLNYIG